MLIPKKYPHLCIVCVEQWYDCEFKDCNFYVGFQEDPECLKELQDLLSNTEIMDQYRDCLKPFFDGYVDPWFHADAATT